MYRLLLGPYVQKNLGNVPLCLFAKNDTVLGCNVVFAFGVLLTHVPDPTLEIGSDTHMAFLLSREVWMGGASLFVLPGRVLNFLSVDVSETEVAGWL